LSSFSAIICLSIRFSESSCAFCLLSWSPPRFSRADSPRLSNFCFHLYRLVWETLKWRDALAIPSVLAIWMAA